MGISDRSLRIVVIAVSVFAVISIALFAYVRFIAPLFAGGQSDVRAVGMPPSLQEKEATLAKINVSADGTPVPPASTSTEARRQKLLADLNPDPQLKTGTSTKTANKTASGAIPAEQFQELNASKLDALQKLNEK